MDLIGILGWVFAAIFILVPMGIFGAMILGREKPAKEEKTDAVEKTGIRFSPANMKKPKRSLIVAENRDITKEEVAAGVFGFGKSNGFSLPDAGSNVAPSRPDLIAPSRQATPSVAIPVQQAKSPSIQPPPPVQQAKKPVTTDSSVKQTRPLLPPPPPLMR